MGIGYEYFCANCGKKQIFFLGSGFALPSVFAKTRRACLEGKHGKKLQRFLTEHPEGQVSPLLILLRCPRCGRCRETPELDMYLPKEGARPELQEDGGSVDWISEEDYELAEEYPHRCGHCRCRMTRVEDLQEVRVVCPRCGKPMSELPSYILWD